MGLTCEGPTDRNAERLYADLVGPFSVPPEEFNQPVQTVYVRKSDKDYEVTTRTLAVSECRRSQQIYQRALRFVGQCSAEIPTPLCRKIAERVNIRWFSPVTPSQAWTDLAQWKRKTKVLVDTPTDPVDSAHQTVAAALKPKEKGGLGIVFDSSDQSPPRTMEQILIDGKATCLDFFTLCKGFDIPGVALVPIVLWRDQQGNKRLHLMVGVKVDSSDTLVAIMDLSESTAKLPEGFYFGPPRVGDVYGEVGNLKLFAEYRNREGATAPTRKAALLAWQEGLSFEPMSDTINYNLAARLASEGKCEQVKAHLDITRAANLLFPDLQLPLERCRP